MANCENCKDKGYTMEVINSGEVFCMGDDPIVEKKPCQHCKKKCEYCGGKGYREVLVNYAEFHYYGDEPIIEKESCEECWTAEENDEEVG